MRQDGREFRRATWALAAVLILPGGANAKEGRGSASAAPAGALRVEGQVERPLTLSAEDLARMPRRSVEAKDHDGRSARYEGVLLADVLKAAGAPLGDALRGAQLSKYVLVEAADGYGAVFALPELDPAFTDELVLLADRRDGQPLPPSAGPLRLVVSHEKRQGRWVRQVTALKVLQANP